MSKEQKSSSEQNQESGTVLSAANIVSRLTLRQEKRLMDRLEKRGWKPTNYLRADGWISPYSFIEYRFEQALKIEDLIGAKL